MPTQLYVPNQDILQPETVREIVTADSAPADVQQVIVVANWPHPVVYVGNCTSTTFTSTFSPVSTSPWFIDTSVTLTSSTAPISLLTSNGTYYASTVSGFVHQWPEVSVEVPWKATPRVVPKTIKNSIKRALKLISNFGMEEDARIFLSGQEIEVSHPDSMFKFVMLKDRSVMQATERPGHSTPYKLSLYTKTNIHVADLCVILKDTPLLDQILALAMFVKTGNEVQLLEKANFRALNTDLDICRSIAVENPMLQKKLRVDSLTLH